MNFEKALNTDEEELIQCLEAEFLKSKFCQPEFLAYDDPAKDLGVDSIDPKEALKMLLAPSAKCTELQEQWDFDGNVIGYKESVFPTDSSLQEKLALMDPATRPAASQGSDPLTGFAKLPFWPGGIEKEREISVIDENWEESQPKQEEKFDPWDFEKGFRSAIPGFQGVPSDELNDDINFQLPTKSSFIDTNELLVEPFDFLLPKSEDEIANSQKKPAVVVDLTHMKMPTLSTTVVSDANYKYASRVDPREAVSSSDFKQKIPEPARQYPFELDTFQKQAVLRMEAHENVFVAAHTSAGKTVVAEYAIAMALKHKARVIYTSPIKALSNQKFRDFRGVFGDDSIGIITGDIQLRPEASCLIMTTEILRSMLYNGSDVIRDTEWVIFDEVHYVNDPERGHVWEEAMILLPDNVSIVALSATVPNAMDFAEWIGQIKKKRVHVITTAFRPVPLEHNLCITWGVDKLYPILKPHSVSLDQRIYRLAMASKPAKSDSKRNYQQPGTLAPVQERQAYSNLIKALQKTDKLPAVVFVFSKKKIEDLTFELGGKINLLKAEESGKVHKFFMKSLSKLKDVDKKLPQIQKMISLLKVGIGIHHSGVLPLLKEIVEILFQRGLVKILFATETFAMGVNMPTRTVVFDNIQKHDGKRRRELLPSEYIQMAGRAGRRGIDPIGTVIILCRNEVPEISILDRMMLGKPVHLESKFRLTTSLVLGMMRVEHLKMEDVLRRTFAEYGWFRQKGDFEDEHKELVLKRRALPKLECSTCSGDIFQYYDALAKYWSYWSNFMIRLFCERGASGLFLLGRPIFCYYANVENLPQGGQKVYHELKIGLFVTCAMANNEMVIRALIPVPTDQSQKSIESLPISKQFPNILACPSVGNDFKLPDADGLANDLESGRLKLEPVDLKPIDIALLISNKQLRIPPLPITQGVSKDALSKAEGELLKLLRSIKPPDWSSMQALFLDPLKSSAAIQFSNLQLVNDAAELGDLRYQTTVGFVCKTCPKFDEHLNLVHSDQTIAKRLAAIRHHLSSDSLALGNDYDSYIDILDQMGFIDKQRSVLLLKGHVACIIGQHHDVLITELLFTGVFSDLSASELAGVLSPFVTEARMEEPEGPKASPNLEKAVQAVKKAGAEYGKKLYDRKLTTSPDSVISDDLRWGMVDPVYHWANGNSFAEVKAMTPIDEGLIVRCIQRVDELIRDLRDAARKIGEVGLENRLSEAQNAIKRDIVFAASLYLQ